jgi:hypothetical protein
MMVGNYFEGSGRGIIDPDVRWTKEKHEKYQSNSF